MTENHKQPTRPTPPRHIYRLALFYWLASSILLFLGVIATLTIVIGISFQRNSQAAREYQQAQFEKMISDIQSGKTKSIYLYSSSETDGLLKRLKNVPEVEEIYLDLTDVSDNGMQSLRSLPKLKSLIIYGGNPSVSDQGFEHIKSITSLENLELINTKITDRSLRYLQDLPNLKKLALFHEAWRGPTFTDAGLAHLKTLKHLEQLELTGGWVSDDAVKELQKELPNCKIVSKGGG